MTGGKGLRGRGAAAHIGGWEDTGLRENNHDLSVGTACGPGPGGEGSAEELLTPCLLWFSVCQDPALVPAEGSKLSVTGTLPADRDAGRTRSHALCRLPRVSSLLPSMCFHQL